MPRIIPISTVRRQLSQIVEELHRKKEAVYVTQHGRPAAVLVDYRHYEALVARAEGKSGGQQKTTYPKPSLLSRLAEIAEEVGPEDLAEQHDHYLYGSDRK